MTCPFLMYSCGNESINGVCCYCNGCNDCGLNYYVQDVLHDKDIKKGACRPQDSCFRVVIIPRG